MKLITALFLLISLVNAQEKYTTIKTSCIQQSEHSGKSLDQLKQILLGQAKQEALGELYGQLMYSKTDMTDGKIMSEQIRQRAVGSVRVEGNPKFYNGSDFGSICADVTSYITKKDLEKYSPKKATLKHYCFNDSTVAMKDIKKYAKFGAYKEIISQFKPALKLSNEQSESFIHGFKISNDNFDFDTASYCFDAVATILPYELEIGNKTVSKKHDKIKPLNNDKLDDTIYGKWYGALWWEKVNYSVFMELTIKKNNTFNVRWFRGDEFDANYAGQVLHNNNKVMLLSDVEKVKTWNAYSYDLNFDKNNLILNGKSPTTKTLTGVKLVKVKKFPEENIISNTDNLNGLWYGYQKDCSSDYKYGMLHIKINGNNITKFWYDSGDNYGYYDLHPLIQDNRVYAPEEDNQDKYFVNDVNMNIKYKKAGTVGFDLKFINGKLIGKRLNSDDKCKNTKIYLEKVSELPPFPIKKAMLK